MRWLPLSEDEISSEIGGLDVAEQVHLIRSFLSEHIKTAREQLVDDREGLRAEVIAYSVLDSLGSLSLADEKHLSGGGMRIRRCIEKFCSRPELTNYSVPALMQALGKSPSCRFRELRRQCSDLFHRHWQPGALPTINNDICEEAVRDLIGDDNLEVLIRECPRITLSQCKLSRMLASKRNALTHQLIRKGLSSSWTAGKPYYICYFNDEDEINCPDRWNLVIPSSYLLDLCDAGLESSCTYLIENQIAPYPMLMRKAAWLAE